MSDFHVLAGPDDRIVHPNIRTLTTDDLKQALSLGYRDFMAKPSHVVFLCILYPIVGIVLAAWTSGANSLPLLFPLMSGFALLGPLAGLGLYEISRRREEGRDTSWTHAFDVIRSPAIPAIIAVGAFLVAVFLAWLLAAQAVYTSIYGDEQPATIFAFFHDVLTTSRGWTLIAVGCAVGAVFALVVLCTTVIAFPLLLDRDVGALEAIATSFRVVAANPGAMIQWGILVGVLLALGSLPIFAGLAVVIPVLGHATWHLYRLAVTSPNARLSM